MASSNKKPVVMVIDDDDPTRMMATEFLSQAGFDVVEYSGGTAALADLSQQSADIVVLDVEMPDVDGFSVCRQMRTTPGYESIPILMLTGLNNNDSIELAFDAGATDFATKPINWTLLCHRLQYMLRAWRSAKDLAYNEKSLASAQRIAQLGNWHLKTDSDEMYWSDQLYSIFGCDKSDSLPTKEVFLNFVHSGDRECVATWLEDVSSSSSHSPSIDFRVTPRGGGERYVRQQVEQSLDQSGNIESLSGVVQDFTEKRRADLRIEQLAYYDSVTGIPNRTFFQQKVDESIAKANADTRRIAVLYIDMSDFKLVNDTLGHASGDLMLNEIAERILNCTSDCSNGIPCYSPTWVARMGADEFTVLLTGLESSTQAESVAEDIINKLANPFLLND